MSEILEHELSALKPADEPEPETEEPSAPPKAWIVAYEEIGLLNVVAESQEKLVERLNHMRWIAGLAGCPKGSCNFEPIEVLSNNPGQPEVTTIWIDPMRVLAVLDRFVPRAEQAASGPGVPLLPPALLAMLEGRVPAPTPEGDVVEVVVEPEPEPEPPGSGPKRWLSTETRPKPEPKGE